MLICCSIHSYTFMDRIMKFKLRMQANHTEGARLNIDLKYTFNPIPLITLMTTAKVHFDTPRGMERHLPCACPWQVYFFMSQGVSKCTVGLAEVIRVF